MVIVIKNCLVDGVPYNGDLSGYLDRDSAAGGQSEIDSTIGSRMDTLQLYLFDKYNQIFIPERAEIIIYDFPAADLPEGWTGFPAMAPILDQPAANSVPLDYQYDTGWLYDSDAYYDTAPPPTGPQQPANWTPRLFGGYVSKAVYSSASGGVERTWNIQAQDYTILTKYRVGNASYGIDNEHPLGWTDQQVVQDFLAQCAPDVDTSQVGEIFGLLPPISFPQHTIEQFMQRVVKITNATYRVDYYKRMEYLTLGTIPAQFGFSTQPNFGLFLLPGELPTFPGEQWEGGHDETELINRVWVVGASFVGDGQTYVVSPPPDGVQWIFPLPAKMKGITTATVTVNGVDQGAPGLLGTDGTLEPGSQSTWNAPVLIGTGGIGQPPVLAFQTPPAASAPVGALIESYQMTTPSLSDYVRFLCAGPDGNIWATDYANSSGQGGVWQVTPTGGEFTRYPLAGSCPVGICAGPDGNIWVADRVWFGQVWQITPAGVAVAFPCNRGGGLDYLHGICAGPDGNLWVTSGGNDANNGQGGVWKITPSGVATFYALTGSACEGICAGPDGNLWVADVLQGAVWKVTTAGVGTKYVIAGSALHNDCIAGPDGNIWLDDTAAGGVWVVAPATGAATFVPLAGTGEVVGMCSGADGNVWAADYTHGGLWQIDPATQTGELVQTVAGAGLAEICAGPDGNLWVSDFTNGKLDKFGYGSVGDIVVTGDFEYPLIQVISNPAQVASTGGVYFDYLLRDTRITSIAEAQQVGHAKLSTQGVPKGAGGLTSRYKSWGGQLLQVGQTVLLYNPTLYKNIPQATAGFMALLITNMTTTLTDDTVTPWLITVDFSDQPDLADDDVFTQALNEAGRINAALGVGDVDDVVEDQQTLSDYLALLDAMTASATTPGTNKYDNSQDYDSGLIYES